MVEAPETLPIEVNRATTTAIINLLLKLRDEGKFRKKKKPVNGGSHA
jgi:hypothetical protein